MRKIGKTAIFNYQDNDGDLIVYLSEYLDEHAKIAYDFFEVEMPKEKVVINIIPTKKEYDEIYRKTNGLGADFKLPGWAIGNHNNGVITYLSLHDYKNTTHAYKDVKLEDAMPYYKKTIFHEYVHYVNWLFEEVHKCCRTEKYLVEGIAGYLSGQKDGLNLKLKASKEDILDRNKAFYSDYYLLTKYFVENYDKDYVLEVFQSNRQARELLETELYDKAKAYYAESEK